MSRWWTGQKLAVVNGENLAVLWLGRTSLVDCYKRFENRLKLAFMHFCQLALKNLVQVSVSGNEQLMHVVVYVACCT